MDYYPNELYHYGVLGMKWGVRRYQNADGSLTAAGRLRYGAGQAREGVRKAASSARSYGSNAYNKAKATYNRKVTKADIGKIAATAGVVAVAALAIKHRGAISTGMKFAGKMAKSYGKVTMQSIANSGAVAKGKAALSNAKFTAERYGRVAGLKTKTAVAKAKVGTRHAVNDAKATLERKRRIANQVEEAFPGAKTAVRNAASQAKFDAERYGRVAGLKTKTAVAKAKVGTRHAVNDAKATLERKRRIANQVEEAFPGVRTSARNLGNQVKRTASDAKFNAQRYGRVASLKTKTAVAKAKVGTRHAINDAKNTLERKRRINKTVNDVFKARKTVHK